jgi:tetratricopeptide (TPR) repeat protein
MYEDDLLRRLESLERLCRLYPDDWLGGQRLTHEYVEKEEWGKALVFAEPTWRVNKANPFVAWGLLEELAMGYENLGQADKAERLLDEYLADPAARFSSPARNYRSKLLTRRGRFDEALAEIDHMAADRPDDPDHFLRRGVVHLYRDDFTGAEREFLKSMDQRDTLARLEALGVLSDLSLARGQVGEAIERMLRRLGMVEGREGMPAAIRQGVEVDCHQRLARLYRVSNRLPEAAREIEAASRIVDSVTSPRLTVLLETLHLSALIALDMGREEEFEEQSERIKRAVELEGFPRLMRTYYYLLGYRELKRNDFERAIMFFGKSVDLMSVPGRLGLQKDEADPQFLFALAEAYDRLESRSTIRALPAFEKVTQPVFSRLWSRGDLYAKSFYHMARIYENEAGFRYATPPEKRENLAKAIETYRKFLSLWGDADPVFAAYVDDARTRLAHLTSPASVPAAKNAGR